MIISTVLVRTHYRYAQDVGAHRFAAERIATLSIAAILSPLPAARIPIETGCIRSRFHGAVKDRRRVMKQIHNVGHVRRDRPAIVWSRRPSFALRRVGRGLTSPRDILEL